MVKKERIHWIDITKGFLIILVVYGHIDYFAETFVNSDVFEFKRYTNFLFLPFYMPAFFVVTGYCSSFNVPFWKFLYKNFKTLLIPSLLIGGVSSYCLDCFLNDGLSYFSFFQIDYLQLLFTGGSWFLSSLFLSKLLVYIFISKYGDSLSVPIISFLFMLIGALLYRHTDIPNILSFQHAMILAPFLWLGYFLKGHNEIFGFKWIIFFLGCTGFAIISFMEYYGIPWPYVNANPTVNFYNVIPYFFLASTQIVILLLFSKYIYKCRLIEILGRHSLVIYLLHCSVFCFIVRHFLFFEIASSLLLFKILFAIFSMALTIFLCILIDIFITKKFGFLKGAWD